MPQHSVLRIRANFVIQDPLIIPGYWLVREMVEVERVDWTGVVEPGPA